MPDGASPQGKKSSPGSAENQPSRWDHLPRYTGSCKHYLLQVPREKIGFVNAILESFDHMARAFTKEKERGILQITVTDDWDEVLLPAIGRLSETVAVRFIEETDDKKI